MSLVSLFLAALAAPIAHQGVAPLTYGGSVAVHPPLAGGIPLRIMPLGASITYGQASTDGNGYRNTLRTLVTVGGNLVNMVGNRQRGSMKDNDVEGWPGFVIDQVHDKATSSVPLWKPNVVLLNAGTNDASQNRNVSSVHERMQSLVDDVFRWVPNTTVILSTLLVNKNAKTEANVDSINAQFIDLTASYRAAGKRVLLVDMHGADGPQLSDLFDDTHPNDGGYVKMANIWYKGLLAVDQLGWLEPAEAVSGLPDDGNA